MIMIPNPDGKMPNAFTEKEEKDDKKTFKEVLKDLADSSSLHGVPKIVSSRQLTVKVLWCLLFIATCSLLGYQLNGLFETYYSYPVQTTIQLDFNAINFPAISLCNMNPVMFSHLNKSGELKTLFEGNSSSTSQSQTTSTSPSSWSTSSQSSSASPASSSASAQSSSIAPPSSSSSSDASTESLSSSNPSTTAFYPDDDNDDDYDWYDFNTEDYNYYDEWDTYADPDDYIKQQLNGNTDEWAERVNTFREVVKTLPLELRKKIGHQLDRFVMSTYFAGSEVKLAKYKNFTSSLYGNCYTLSSKQYVAWRSGPANGVKITLNLETDEYIAKFSTGYGARLVLHDPGTYPLPFNEGITLSPGTETSVGLKMVRISRLGQPYGDCTKGEDFVRLYRKKYSVAACDHFCRVMKAMDLCNCIPTDAPDQITLNKTALPVCNSSIKTDQECLLGIDVSFQKKSSCDCRGPCKETLYEKTISSRYWPTSEYSKHLLMTLCKELEKEVKDEDDLPDTCVSMKENEGKGYSLSDEEYEKHRRNFLRVLIYFEDLNFEKIKQEPLYQDIRFLSDIGGTMGLFLGASFLSLVEVLQLLLEIVLHIKNKMTSNRSVKP